MQMIDSDKEARNTLLRQLYFLGRSEIKINLLILSIVS